MTNWFECKVRYTRVLESGMQKAVTEPYLVDALSFTEAEARITQEMAPYISGDFVVTAVKREKLADVFYDSTGDRWYKVKYNIITIDEKTAAEKRTSATALVQAGELQKALDNFMAGMKGTMADFEVAAVTETAIMDVFPVKLG